MSYGMERFKNYTFPLPFAPNGYVHYALYPTCLPQSRKAGRRMDAPCAMQVSERLGRFRKKRAHRSRFEAGGNRKAESELGATGAIWIGRLCWWVLGWKMILVVYESFIMIGRDSGF